MGSDPRREAYDRRIGQVDEWDEYAAGWDEDPAARAYASAAFASLTDVLDRSRLRLGDARVLDFGCGTGLLTEHLVAAGATVAAVDTSPAMLRVRDAKIAERDWRDTVATTAETPIDESAFDVIVCSSVCSFLDDYPGTVAELVGRLRPGGIFVQWDWERTDADDHGFSGDEVSAALTAAGLSNVEVSTAFVVDIDGESMAPLIGHGSRLTP